MMACSMWSKLTTPSRCLQQRTSIRLTCQSSKITGFRPFSSSTANQVYSSSYPKPKIPKALTFPEFLLDGALDRYKELALIDADNGETLTYGKLKERVNDMGIQFYIRGYKLGETLAVIMPNKLVYPLTVLGAARVGLPVLLVNPTIKSREMTKQMKTTKVVNIITTNTLLPQVRDAITSVRGIKEILVWDKEEEPADKKEIKWSIEMKYNLLMGKPPGWGALPDWDVTSKNTFCYPFTSGVPRGVVLTHRNLGSAIVSLSTLEKDVTSNDVFLSTQTYSNIFTFTFFGCFPFFIGAKSVIMETYELGKFLDTIQKYKVTYAHVAPSTLLELAESPLVTNADLSSLKILLSSDPVEVDLIQRVESRLKGTKVKQAYGMQDLTPPVMVSPSSKIKPGSAGVLLGDTFAKIIDPTTSQELGPNVEGELLIKGGQIMKEFVKVGPTLRDTANIEADSIDSDGFVKTGDRAKVDEEGYWWVTPKPKPEEEAD